MAFPLQNENVVAASEILGYEERVSFVLGSSRSGKSTFLSKIISAFPKKKKVFLIADSNEIENNQLGKIKKVNVLSGIENFKDSVLEKLPPGSLVIVDDFFLSSREVESFKKIVNYSAHHYKLAIFLAVHSHLHSGLHFFLNTAANIYLTFSNNSRVFLKTFFSGKYLPFFIKNWKKGLLNKGVFFINSHFEVAFCFVDNLLIRAPLGSIDICEMNELDFVGLNEKYWKIVSVHSSTNENLELTSTTEPSNLEDYYRKELSQLYLSKNQFSKVFKIVRILLQKGLIDDKETILGNFNVYDFLSFTQRPSFSKEFNINNESSDSNEGTSTLGTLGFSYKKTQNEKRKKKKKKEKNNVRNKNDYEYLCKQLKEKNVIIPHSLLRNRLAKSWL